jgi:hypothetical protein
MGDPLRWTGSYQKTFFVLGPSSIESSPCSGEAEVRADRPKAGQKSVPESGASASVQGARTRRVEILDFFTAPRKSDRIASPVSRDLEVPVTLASPENRSVRGLNPHARAASL